MKKKLSFRLIISFLFLLTFAFTPIFSQKNKEKKKDQKSTVTGWEYNKKEVSQVPPDAKKIGTLSKTSMQVTMQGHETVAKNLMPTRYTLQVLLGEPDIKLNGVYYFNPAEAWMPFQDKALSLSSVRYMLNAEQLKPYSSQHKRTKAEMLELEFLESDYINDSSMMVFNLYPAPLLKPFYFKKHEVTNFAYREFVNWVRDSIAHTYLGHLTEKKYIDWDKTIDWNDEALKEMFVQKDDKRLLNTTHLQYAYKDEGGNWQHIAVYPDTMSWVNDHEYAYNQPMADHYFSHPAYDDYPVVGVSYHQAKAFCDWQTQILRAVHKDAPYQLTVDLPRAYEWEWMAWLKKDNFEHYLLDTDWNTDLMLKYDKEMARMRDARTTAQYFAGDYRRDGYIYTYPADLSSKNFKSLRKSQKKEYDPQSVILHLDFNGVSSMGGNVSEWMDENYADNWAFMFNRQLERWTQIGTPAALLAKEMALFYDKRCDKDGYMVCGGSWIDERFSNINGKNKAGIYAKTFLHPTKSHSSVGFRYVVRVDEKL